MQPLISVMVPVYKVEKYLDRCVESISHQTWKNLDIILMEDGSPDRCGQMCDRWAERDSRIRAIHNENQGIGKTRNALLDATDADFLMFVDSDDYLPENAVETLMTRLLADGSDMALGKRMYLYEDGHTADEERVWFKDAVFTPEELFSIENPAVGWHGAVEPWGKIYRRDVFRNIRYPDYGAGEDIYVYPLLVKNCRTISVVNTVVYVYFKRSQSLTHTHTDLTRMQNGEAVLQYARILYDAGFLPGAKRYFRDTVRSFLYIRDLPAKFALLNKYFSLEEQGKLIEGLGKRLKLKYHLLHTPLLYRLCRKPVRKFYKMLKLDKRLKHKLQQM